MGYISKDIAVIYDPKQVSLAGLPNFVQIQSKPAVKTYYEVNLQVVSPASAKSRVLITEPSGTVHEFTGTTVVADVGGAVFYIDADPTNTAENIRQALLSDSYIAANFGIDIPFGYGTPFTTNGDTLNIKSKGAGTAFNIALTLPDDAPTNMYALTVINAASHSGDSITGETGTTVIALDVYIDAGIFLGVDDKPTSVAALGTFVATLSKTYAGALLWFELNKIFAQYGAYNLPPGVTGWFDTGTMRQYRYVARVEGTTNYSFNQSNALYVLNGYGRASDTINLDDYVYTGPVIKLLTNKPRTPYVKGQREYLNFIFSDWTRALTSPPDYTLSILYRAYSASGQFIGAITANIQHRAVFAMVNTCQLDIDTLLTTYPAAGLVRVTLQRDGTVASNDLEYTVRPECLHDLKVFSFLNRLGGWDSFNFDVKPQTDVKVTFDTYNKTLTPAHTKGDGIQAVYAAHLDDVITIVGAPVTNDIAEWLKEMAASTAVLDAQGRYIIKSDFTFTIADSTRNMQVPTMKYQLSETYTND